MTTTGRPAQRRGSAGLRPRAQADQAERRRAREERRADELAADPEAVARDLCLRLLTVRPRSAGELADALAGRGVADDVAARVLERFTEVGLIDDAAFARAFVTSRQASRGLARRALRTELRRKGLDDETADDAVALVDDAAEEEVGRRLARKRIAASPGLAPEVVLRRTAGALARRGYAPGLAYRLVREELAAARGEASDEAVAVEDPADL